MTARPLSLLPLLAACALPGEAPEAGARDGIRTPSTAATLSGLSATETEVRSSDLTTGDYFGQTVWGLGDIDADGYDDVAIGAMADDSGASHGGAIYVYLGSATGLDTSTELELHPSDLGSIDSVGWYRGGAGDFDGDGYRDIIFGSIAHDHALGNEGAAWIFYGSVSGIDAASEEELTQVTPGLHDGWGRNATSAGDVDGDGLDDVLVGCNGCDDYYTDWGAAFVYLGTSSGIDQASEITFTEGSGDTTGTYGSEVLGGADFNADGYADIVVGVPTAYIGLAYIYLGSATGPDPTAGQKVLPSDYPISSFTRGLAAADFDQDGQDDLAIGASGDDDHGTSAGAVYVYVGAASGVNTSLEAKWSTSDVTTMDAVGGRLSAGSDLDGDGFPELLLGVSAADHSGLTNPGAVYIMYGSATGLALATEDKLVLASPAADDYLGLSIAAVGDLDGDGYDELAAGVPRQDSPPDAGSVVIWSGMCRDADSDGVCTDDDCDDTDSSVGAATAWYTDADGDGYGDPTASTESCTQPSGTVADGTDCDDTDAAVNPAATEICDADDTDEDCSGDADDDDTGVDSSTFDTWYTDADSDGYGDAGSPQSQCDQPSGAVADDTDCDDTDAAVNPGANEVCDASDTDEDCSGDADDSDTGVDSSTLTTWYTDADGDGYGDPTTGTDLCDGASGTVADGTDCDDTDPAVNPGQTEVCDTSSPSVDEDCSGDADDDDPGVDTSTQTTWYTDADSDGYGDPGTGIALCEQPSGTVADGTDCDDADAAVNPGQTEVCDASDVDEDCSGAADDDDPGVDATSRTAWYADADSDGYGDPTSGVSLCEQPSGTVADGTDCDDTDPAVNPGQVEICDLADTDEDCNGLADDDDPGVDTTTFGTWYADADADTFGDPAAPGSACERPAGTVVDDTDCDDTDPFVNPDGIEICDEDDTDEDCDGLADDADPGVSGKTTVHVDADGDTYGDPALTEDWCDPPAGTTVDATDCDDADPDIHPGADEVCDTASPSVDEDCDGLADDADDDAVGEGTWYTDADGDGYGEDASARPACDALASEVDRGGDCDDADPDAWPGAPEVAGDGVDQDCDGSDASAPEEDEGKGSCSSTGPSPPSGLLVALGLLAASRRRRALPLRPAQP